jgi:cytochrome c-type biogenesis protein CcmE
MTRTSDDPRIAQETCGLSAAHSDAEACVVQREATLECLMALVPKSRAARRRLAIFAVATPVLIIASGLALYGLSGSISYFYTPAQALAAHVNPGRPIDLGGLVQPGSLVKQSDGEIDFTIMDHRASAPVTFRGDVPDLFREGQGVVVTGAFNQSRVFVATQILAKHDERYMPAALTRALKQQGVWRGTPAAAARP